MKLCGRRTRCNRTAQIRLVCEWNGVQGNKEKCMSRADYNRTEQKIEEQRTNITKRKKIEQDITE